MAGRRYRSNRRGGSASRRYGGAGHGPRQGFIFLCLIGGVVFVFGLVVVVVVSTSGSAPRSESRIVAGGRTNRPVFSRLDSPEETPGVPPAPVVREEPEPEELPPPEEPPPEEPLPQDPEVPQDPPLAEPPPVVEPPRPPAREPPKAAPAVAVNTVFKMLITGKLGKENLSPSDPRTWSRLGYCLQHEAAEQHWLAFSDGKVKVIRKAGEKQTGGAKVPEGFPDSANRKNPGHRLVIHATATFDGNIEFQGLKTGSKYSCRLDCSLEKRKGLGFQSTKSFSVKTRITPAVAARDADGDPAQLRMAYYAALEELCLELLGMAPFKS